ncbi:hypothetical protein [Leptolyngbya sp. FACHB-261]|uniref:hypothetical protein n=1 Tax=Leptolyngbya sp. FACHB-261 TaxID=2692806 RepID=UPI00168532E7|nr:hypothetical protein [Leptolyngbya sp. FACHB-261]MBD2099340.1 hypothetical protein [Leptolyngbya sp. FACHB-261]
MSNYLVTVLSDRNTAEAAYTALEKEDLPMQAVAILGRGYKSADEYGLIDPKEQAQKQINLMSTWLIPFGFFAGFAFNRITGLTLLEGLGTLGNGALGGLLGALSGALGAYVVGGGVGLAVGGGDALTYRNRLDQGKYLIVVRGSESLTRRATNILRPFGPENIQGYTDPTEPIE